jgi:hypothetical protein
VREEVRPMWIVLLLLVVLVVILLLGSVAYRGRAGAGVATSPQTTIVETGHRADTRRTESRTVTRETEIVEREE